ncbi:MAG: hypothetical protein HDS30_07860 [Bacteroides sp.]|nr:hypothetical protein [Bacteroides sp.]
MVDKYKHILMGIVLALFPSVLSAQRISAEEFFQHINYEQSKIDNYRQGNNDAKSFLDMDNAIQTACRHEDPQAYLDYIVIRFNRISCNMNFAAAKIAAEIAKYIANNQYNVDISSVVIQEGIDKYNTLTEFFLETANEWLKNYQDGLRKYIASYGNPDIEYLRLDDKFMKLYGVEPSVR